MTGENPLGEPPEEFMRGTPECNRLLAAWRGIVAMAPAGVLTSADWLFVKLCSQQVAICERTSAKAADRALLDKLLGQIGCSPSGRSKLTLNKAKAADARQPDDWAELAAERLPQKVQ